MMVVSLAGSPSQRSRSGVLLDAAGDWLQRHGVEVVRYAVRDFEPADLIHARFDSPVVQRFAEHVEQADGLLVATPVYKASFAGALKTLLDLLPERALANKAVLPLASGGSAAHMLALDYALAGAGGAQGTGDPARRVRRGPADRLCRGQPAGATG